MTERSIQNIIVSNDKIIQDLLSSDSSKFLGIQAARKSSMKSIDSLTNVLIDICGGRDPETGEYLGAFEVNSVKEYLVDQEIGQVLMEYINVLPYYLNDNGYDVARLAVNTYEVQIFENSPWSDMTFSEAHFVDVKMEEAIGIIRAYQLDVVQLENEILIEELIKEKNSL